MSGGGGGTGGSNRSTISTRRYGSTVGVKTSMGRGGITSAASPNGPMGKPDRKNEGLGQAKVAAPAPAAVPVPGAAGAGSGSDVEAMARTTAAVAQGRRRLARGGGLSNVRFGGATLG